MPHIDTTTVTISASTTTASAALPNLTEKIRVSNPTTAICYLKTGIGSATATATCQFIGAYETAILEKKKNHDYIAVILSTGTGSIAVSPEGGG